MSEPISKKRLEGIKELYWCGSNPLVTIHALELIAEVDRLTAEVGSLREQLKAANAVCEEVSEAQDPVKRPRNFERMFSKLDAWRLTKTKEKKSG